MADGVPYGVTPWVPCRWPWRWPWRPRCLRRLDHVLHVLVWALLRWLLLPATHRLFRYAGDDGLVGLAAGHAHGLRVGGLRGLRRWRLRLRHGLRRLRPSGASGATLAGRLAGLVAVALQHTQAELKL